MFQPGDKVKVNTDHKNFSVATHKDQEFKILTAKDSRGKEIEYTIDEVSVLKAAEDRKEDIELVCIKEDATKKRYAAEYFLSVVKK